MTTYILSDAERYGDIERILMATEPLSDELRSARQTFNRPRRSLFGLGRRDGSYASEQGRQTGLRQRG